VAEAKRVALSGVPIGTYFTTTIADRGQLCLKIAAGEILVLSDDPPYLLLPPLADVPVTTVASPNFRPQADGIADRRRKPQFGDIALWSRDKAQQRRALCGKRDGAPPEVFIDLATGEALPLLGVEGVVSSLWSKWEALDRQHGIICRFPPRRLTL
jgi:hypothetical protein